MPVDPNYVTQLNEVAQVILKHGVDAVRNNKQLLVDAYKQVVGRDPGSVSQVVRYLESSRVMGAARGFVKDIGPALHTIKDAGLRVSSSALRHFDKALPALGSSAGAAGSAGAGTAGAGSAGGTGAAATGITAGTVYGAIAIGALVLAVAAGGYMWYYHDKPHSEPVQAGHRTEADPYVVEKGIQEAHEFSVVRIRGTRGFNVISVRPSWKIRDGDLRWNQIRSGGTRHERIPKSNVDVLGAFRTRAEASEHVGRLVEKGDNKVFGWGTSSAIVAILSGKRHVLDDLSALDIATVRRVQGGRSNLDDDDRDWED